MTFPQTDDWYRYIENTAAKWQVPGVAVAVVKGNDVLFCDGIGVRDISGQKMTADTVLPIGSCTKAFTATLIGSAVDEGKMEWDAPIRRYLPWFDLSNQYAAANLTLRDMACHRSGLPRHELMWYMEPASREELVRRLKFLEPSDELRSSFQYQNIMYVTLGEAVQQALSKSWDELLVERLFHPLGMESTVPVVPTPDMNNAATGYTLFRGEVTEAEVYDAYHIGPAGSIGSSVRDMIPWMRFNLGNGTVNGRKLLSQAQLGMLHRPHMVVPELDMGWPEIHGSSYGLGWVVQTYRGQVRIQHTGSINGFFSVIYLMPAEQIGVVMLTNSDSHMLSLALGNWLCDEALGVEPADWQARSQKLHEQARQAGRERVASMKAARCDGTEPSHEIGAYEGEYENPGYGRVVIRRHEDGLLIARHGVRFVAEHRHYDWFDMKWEFAGSTQYFPLRFETDEHGDIHQFMIRLEPDERVGEIVFTRISEQTIPHPVNL